MIAELFDYSFAYCGYHCGVVVTDLNSKMFLGSQVKDSFNAELSALCWSLLWLLQVPHVPAAQLHYDCQGAASSVQSYRSSSTNCAIVDFAKVMYFYATTYLVIELLHVKGHSGQPWNEHSDRICAHLLLGDATSLAEKNAAHTIVGLSIHSSMLAVDVAVGLFKGPQYPVLVESHAVVSQASVPNYHCPSRSEEQ